MYNLLVKTVILITGEQRGHTTIYNRAIHSFVRRDTYYIIRIEYFEIKLRLGTMMAQRQVSQNKSDFVNLLLLFPSHFSSFGLSTLLNFYENKE